MTQKTDTAAPTGRTRMTAEERQAAIAMAAVPVFAEKGFAGSTTKELARSAGVSEALLYRHFPSKESIYEHIQNQICESNSAIQDFVCSLAPSTESVVKMIYLLHKIIYGTKDSHRVGNAIPRLMVQSLLEDGEFTRSFHEPRFNRMLPFMEAACDVAIREGDMVAGPLSHHERQWFPHHLAVCLRLAELPEKEVFEYQATRINRLIHAVWFSLRGIGMTDDAIETYLIPKELDPVIDDVLHRAGILTKSE